MTYQNLEQIIQSAIKDNRYRKLAANQYRVKIPKNASRNVSMYDLAPKCKAIGITHVHLYEQTTWFVELDLVISDKLLKKWNLVL